MKRFYLVLVLMLALVQVLPVAFAQEETEEMAATAEKKKAPTMAAIPTLLSKARYLTRKKANLRAQYYGFIRSASWCVPCQVFLPQLLKEYSRMKGARMELVLLGQEEEPVVKNYIKEHGYSIPAVMPAELGTVPGLSYENLGYPSMCIVDADGNFIASNGGANMMKWKDILKEHKKKLLKEKREAKKQSLLED